MKKIIEFLIGILLAIVYPDRILNLFKVRNLDQNSNKFLGNDNFVKIVALVVAIIFVITSRHDTEAQAPTTQNLYGMPLIQLLDESYTHIVTDPIPSHVTVILTGDQEEISLFLAGEGRGSISLFLDLDGLELDEEHDYVPIRIEGGEAFSPIVTPSAISGIRIVEKEERPFRVDLTTINGDVFEKLREPSSRYRFRKVYEPNYVIIRGAGEILDEIVEVRAVFNAIEIDVDEVSDMVGYPLEFSVQIVVFDASTNRVDVEIDPGVVSVEVEFYEEVRTINIEVDRDMVIRPLHLYNVIDVTADIDEIEVWGDFADMKDPLDLPHINIRDLDDEGRITIPILLPNNVESDTEEITITVIYDEIPPPEEDEDEDEDDEDDEDDDDDD